MSDIYIDIYTYVSEASMESSYSSLFLKEFSEYFLSSETSEVMSGSRHRRMNAVRIRKETLQSIEERPTETERESEKEREKRERGQAAMLVQALNVPRGSYVPETVDRDAGYEAVPPTETTMRTHRLVGEIIEHCDVLARRSSRGGGEAEETSTSERSLTMNGVCTKSPSSRTRRKRRFRATQWIEKEVTGPWEAEASRVQLLIQEENARMRGKWTW